jgi:activator of 2-hydroxyglutaryl-CoA dehydratase
MITGGIDVGAETVKAAICADNELVGWGIVKTGLDRKGSADKALKLAERATTGACRAAASTVGRDRSFEIVGSFPYAKV